MGVGIRIRAFTLIELMICIALLSIWMAVPIAATANLHAVTREEHVREALRNARLQLARLERTPFEQLPPRVVRGREVRLQEGCVEVRAREGGREIPARVEGGRVRFDRNVEAVVDYAFLPALEGEAHTVRGAVRTNLPLQEVLAVRLARGERSSPLSGWSARDGLLHLPAGLEGQVVEVDYRSSKLQLRITGKFLDESLRPSDRPTRLKLIELTELYGPREGGLRLTLLRGASP